MKTIPEFVAAVVQDYLDQLRKIFPGNIVGVYLTGSVSLGDYFSNKSDIDFITIINEEGSHRLHKLKNLHHSIEKRYGYPKLNGYYLTINGIIHKQTSFPSFFKNGWHQQRIFELRNFSLYELKWFSYPAYGPPAEELLMKVDIDDVFSELFANINGYWTNWIRKYSTISIHQLLLILFPRLTEWGLLGIARLLYTIKTGAVTSKTGAGEYYLARLPEEFKSIMTTAIETRRLNSTELKPSIKRAEATIKCMEWFRVEFIETYKRQLPLPNHRPA